MAWVKRNIEAPIRVGLDWPATWLAEDKGLIKAWEIGRQLAISRHDLAEAALRDELPAVNWRGGVAKKIKKPHKFGSLHYLAQWQGLRNEDLSINTSEEITLTCAAHGMQVTYTADLNKLTDADTDESSDEKDPNDRPTPGIPEQPLFP